MHLTAENQAAEIQRPGGTGNEVEGEGALLGARTFGLGFDRGATSARNLKFRMREGRMGLVCSEGGRWSGLVIVELEGDEVS